MDKSILIVDDNEDDRYLLRRYLEMAGVTGDIYEAVNGNDALDFLKPYEAGVEIYGDKFPPLIIFLDINMPVMNGYEFLNAFSELRSTDTRYSSIVITMFTSSAHAEDAAITEKYAFVKDYMIKMPDSPEVLSRFIFQVIAN